MVYVYLITSNGREYVGVTANIRRRSKDHMKADSHVGRSMRAHGFDIKILSHHDSHEAAFEEERFQILQRGSRYPGGLNHTAGGDGVVKPTPDVREKLSRAMKKRHKLGDNSLYKLAGQVALSAEAAQRQRVASSERMTRLNADPAFREASRQRMIERMKSRYPSSA